MSTSSEVFNLCRVCSSPGLYDIHNVIPFFLHMTENEYLSWRSIAEMMNEVTGFEISKTDGLPQKICTICISYLQHAVNFRQQMQTTTKNLRSGNANGIASGSSETSPVEANSSKFYPINEIRISKRAYEELNAELDQFFADNNYGDSEDSSDDDQQSNDVNEYNPNRFKKVETTKTAIHNFFNYTEKAFEEDIISELNGIEIKIPDDNRERKCAACKCRFQLITSYESHMKVCIENKLISFIIECQQLLIIKKHKAISSFEFLRRSIFSLKNVVKALALSYSVITRKQPKKQVKSDVAPNKEILTGLDSSLFQAPDDISKPSRPLLRKTKQPLTAPSTSSINTLVRKPASNTPVSQLSQTPVAAAKCTECNIGFGDVGELENHNQMTHNNSGKKSKSNNSNQSVIRLGGTPHDYLQEGIVDVLSLRGSGRRSPQTIELNSKK
ncbi:hypothetical protein Bhyg_00814 [Pseudolycoriella hygida]|uniref:ZAD domain-containing protein n=1 Tax=Pseudolycoriella hygida TaxID=35572 RepID=A0A9Q0S4X9_9DIPT|nr:hypothetical protein Bhyg_00814 [Pseudolycoriella hygida]